MFCLDWFFMIAFHTQMEQVPILKMNLNKSSAILIKINNFLKGGCDGCLNLQGAMFVPPELLKIENDSDDGNGDEESVSWSCI